MPRKKKQPIQDPPRSIQSIQAQVLGETGNGEKDGQIWLTRISKTIRFREEMPNGARDWKRYYEWFEGEQWIERGQEGRDLATDYARNTATVNATGSIALSYVPFLINGQILFKLKPQKPTENVSAEIQQALLNYEWTERGMTEQAKLIVQDAVIIGHGIGKSGYIVEVDEARKKSDGEIEYRDYIRQDAAYIERVDPLLFLFDLSAKDGTLKTARWCAECFFTPYDDVVANTNYKQSVIQRIFSGEYKMEFRKGFGGIGMTDATWSKSIGQPIPEDRLVALWEIWDKKYKKHYIFAEGVTEPLFEEEWPYEYLDGFPYVKVDYIKVPNKPYGMGVMRQAEDQQMQLNRIRTAQFLHIRSHNRKFMAIAGAVQPENLKDFAELPDGAVIPVEREGAIQPIQDAPMSQDFQVVEGRIASDIEQLTGADALLQGRPLPSRTTAGEVSARTNILRLKADDRVSAVERMVTELAVQVLQHLKANRTLPDVIEIVGAMGAFWREFTNEEIQADVDVTVEYFAAPKFDPAVDRQQKLQILQLAIQALPAMQGQEQAFDIPALLGWVLKSFDYKDAGQFFKPLNTPTAPIKEDEVNQSPAMGGMSAPTAVGEQPGPGQPGEGLSPQDLLMQLQGSGVGGQGELPVM
jgi:hypothetical protein